MSLDIYPVILIFLILFSSLISLRLGISVSIIEILTGLIFGNIGILKTEPWMILIASFGGILLTFLSGIEIDTQILRKKFKETFLIGFLSFLTPFTIISLLMYFIIGWDLLPSLLAGTALSETSIAIVYSALVQQNLNNINLGKILIGATFITNLFTAIALSILFIKPDLSTVIFYIISIFLLFIAYKYSYIIFNSKALKNKVVEIEIKYIFLLLSIIIFFANFGKGQAILPAFLLGLLLSDYFKENATASKSKDRIKTVGFAIITPIFFIVGGMNVSIELIITSLGLFILIFITRQASKFLGVYFISNKYFNKNKKYITAMMSTGLTFGLVATVFGLNNGILDEMTYSILTGVLVLSAVLPSLAAEKFFFPHNEDLN
ncbi:MAG: cation:proton antiporter [Methanobacteriaceae archaeon]|nr:cation:proton antiporter [Methanobacteriaceae archaeon]